MCPANLRGRMKVLAQRLKPLMSLMTKKTRIDARRVAEIIGCSRKTVLNGGAGTAQLTRIRNGSTQVRFILEEVLAFAEKQERDAQRRLPRNQLDNDVVNSHTFYHYCPLLTVSVKKKSCKHEAYW